MTVRSSSAVFALALVTLAGVVYSQATSSGSDGMPKYHLYGTYERLSKSQLQGMDRKVAKHFADAPLSDVLQQLAVAPYRVVADPLLYRDAKITADFEAKEVGECLDEIAAMLNGRWEQSGKTLMLRGRESSLNLPVDDGQIPDITLDGPKQLQGQKAGGPISTEGYRIEVRDGVTKVFVWDPKTQKYVQLSDKQAQEHQKRIRIQTEKLPRIELELPDFEGLRLDRAQLQEMKEKLRELKGLKGKQDGSLFLWPDFLDGKCGLKKWDPKSQKMVPMTPEEQKAFQLKMEAFGHQMEKWGEEFGRQWAKDAEKYAKDADEFAKQWEEEHGKQLEKHLEAQGKQWEEWAKSHEKAWEAFGKELETKARLLDKQGNLRENSKLSEGDRAQLEAEIRAKIQELMKGLPLFGKGGAESGLFVVPDWEPLLALPRSSMGKEPSLQAPAHGDISKLLSSLSETQKNIQKERGYLRISELTKEQRAMLGAEPKGQFALSFTIDGKTVTIKND